MFNPILPGIRHPVRYRYDIRVDNVRLLVVWRAATCFARHRVVCKYIRACVYSQLEILGNPSMSLTTCRCSMSSIICPRTATRWLRTHTLGDVDVRYQICLSKKRTLVQRQRALSSSSDRRHRRRRTADVHDCRYRLRHRRRCCYCRRAAYDNRVGLAPPAATMARDTPTGSAAVGSRDVLSIGWPSNRR